MCYMAASTPEQQQILARLRSLTLENYRRTRWATIDAARKAGITWEEIAEASDQQSKNLMRFYRDNTPPEAG